MSALKSAINHWGLIRNLTPPSQPVRRSPRRGSAAQHTAQMAHPYPTPSGFYPFHSKAFVRYA